MTKEAKNVELQKVQSIEQNLSEQIEKLQNLNKLIRNRAVFQEKKNILDKAIEDMKKDIEANNFEAETYCFSFNLGRYKSDEALRISNPALIKEIAEFVISKIDNKINEIEETIIKEA